jgi:hypothetical protein
MPTFAAVEPLLIRIDALVCRLELASKAIQATKSEGNAPRATRRLYEGVGAGLADRLSTQLQELRRKRGKAREGNTTASVWSVVSASACAQLLDEALLYLQAVHSRGSDSGPGLCEIADQLFSEIAANVPYIAWKGYSVFSAEDSYDKLSDVIRVRYPIGAAWDIPVSVHEFGHYLSDKILAKTGDGASEQTIKQYLASQAARNAAQKADVHTTWPVWLEEVFADVFAATVLGPAFGYSAILLRFDPSQPAAERDGKHPSDAKRVYILLSTLQKLDKEKELAGRLSPSIELLRRYWRDCCVSAGEGANAEPLKADQTLIYGYLAMFYDLLKQSAPLIRYRSWSSVAQLQELLKNPPAGGVAEFKITDLLNAAWLCRVQDPESAGTIDASFVKLCRERLDHER